MLIFGAAFLMVAAVAQSPKISIIPQPVEVKEGVGTFVVNASTKIVLSKEDASIKKVAASLNDELSAATGFSLNIAVGSVIQKNAIYLQLLPTSDAKLGDEGYRLVATGNEVKISANKPPLPPPRSTIEWQVEKSKQFAIRASSLADRFAIPKSKD